MTDENDVVVAVVALDLEKAKRGMEICFATLNWRKEDLLIPVTEVAVDGSRGVPDQGLDGVTAGGPCFDTPQEPPDVHPRVAAARESWITGRLKTIATYGPAAKQDTALAWPFNISIKPPWTDKDIEELDIALAGVEAKFEIPWGAGDPETYQERRNR